MTLEIPVAEIHAAGGYARWHERMTREANAHPFSVCAKMAHTEPRQKMSRDGMLGHKSGRLGPSPKPHLSEHQEQALLIARVDLLAPSVPELRMLFAIPNGGARSKAVAGKLKAEGVRPGVSDLFLSVPKGCYHGLYIEMKAILGRVSDEQKAWIAVAREYGYRVEVCVGADAAWRVLCEYLDIRG